MFGVAYDLWALRDGVYFLYVSKKKVIIIKNVRVHVEGHAKKKIWYDHQWQGDSPRNYTLFPPTPAD